MCGFRRCLLVCMVFVHTGDAVVKFMAVSGRGCAHTYTHSHTHTHTETHTLSRRLGGLYLHTCLLFVYTAERECAHTIGCACVCVCIKCTGINGFLCARRFVFHVGWRKLIRNGDELRRLAVRCDVCAIWCAICSRSRSGALPCDICACMCVCLHMQNA